jgi:hypothetical protein
LPVLAPAFSLERSKQLGIRRFLTDVFVESYHPTLADAYAKASRAGWSLEETEQGFVVHGFDADDQPRDFHFGPDQIDSINGLLDHALSVQMGEQYRLAKYGPDEPESSVEAARRRHEIRDHRMRYYDETYKPHWKRWFGL